ncbi:MAG: DUF2007 domain-containing protein [Muribaculaceae bacterium]|nr:DUF2007 domain-containing protein [Muribaculaceae bacterium]
MATIGTGGWVTVAEYSTEQPAYIACGMLRSHGIEANVGADRMSTLYGAGSTWAPVTLNVPADRAEEAAVLLKEYGDS